MDKQKLITGVCAAVLTPRGEDGNVDTPALQALIGFLLAKGIQSFAVNGATGEYCLTNSTVLRTSLRSIRAVTKDHARIFCGVGSGSEYDSISLARVAEEEGANGLLLPPPFFFPYAQEDVVLFCSRIAQATSLPIILYNLPQFTTGISSESALSLLASQPNVVGIKDSSGSLDNLRALAASHPSAVKVVGNDGVLAAALSEGVCDGVISGVACAYPELISAIFQAGEQGRNQDLQRFAHQLRDLIGWLDRFPTPWGLKWLLEARDVIPATFSQPVTDGRRKQAVEMMTWFKEELRRRSAPAQEVSSNEPIGR